MNFTRQTLKDLKVRPLPRKLDPGSLPEASALYIVSSGMVVERTPSYIVAAGLAGHARNTLGFVGYCDPDTPGGQLLAAKSGGDFLFEKVNVKTKLKAHVERFELSGHADREELRRLRRAMPAPGHRADPRRPPGARLDGENPGREAPAGQDPRSDAAAALPGVGGGAAAPDRRGCDQPREPRVRTASSSSIRAQTSALPAT